MARLYYLAPHSCHQQYHPWSPAGTSHATHFSLHGDPSICFPPSPCRTAVTPTLSPPNIAAGNITTTTGSSFLLVAHFQSHHGPCSQSYSDFSCCVNSIWEVVSRARTVKCVWLCPHPKKGILDLHFVAIGLEYTRLRNLWHEVMQNTMT